MPLFYNYNSNAVHNNNNQSCQFGRYHANIVQPQQQQQQQQYIHSHHHEQRFTKRQMPPTDRLTAFFNRTKNFRF